ncbi:MAG: GTP-binding protein, partial [Bacteroidota bacterium]
EPAAKNGKGYISVVNEDGTVVHPKWITGLHAPKGLGIYGNKLFIADIDQVVVANVQTGRIIRKYRAEGATFLNDVEIGIDGTVYITDTFGGNAIYRIKNGKITQWLKDEALNYPNGLKLSGNNLYVATWGVVTNPKTFETETPGRLLVVDVKQRRIKNITTPIGNLDGLVTVGDSFLVSDWISGGLISIKKSGEAKKVKDLNAGSADIMYVKDKNVIIVPQMLDGTLVACKLTE